MDITLARLRDKVSTTGTTVARVICYKDRLKYFMCPSNSMDSSQRRRRRHRKVPQGTRISRFILAQCNTYISKLRTHRAPTCQ